MPYRVRAADREAFKRCRRQWDLGSRNRQDYEPLPAGERPVDLDRAVRAALAVYYFPGMWEWNRAIVRPLVHQALERSVAAQGATAGVEQALARGHTLLDAYAAWAPSADAFTPVRVDVDFEVNIPDPAASDLVSNLASDLVSVDGEAIRFTDRVDLLVVDEFDAYWVVQHRLVAGRAWAELDELLLDERTVAWCWAWPQYYLGMRIAGTVYNEISLEATAAAGAEAGGPARVGHRRMYAQATAAPGEPVRVEGTEDFRRTRIARGEPELSRAAELLAAEAAEAAGPAVAVYPNPSPAACGPCPYRAPCLVLTAGGDPAAVLATSYRKRGPEAVEEGRLGGSTWSMNRGAAPPPWARRGR